MPGSWNKAYSLPDNLSNKQVPWIKQPWIISNWFCGKLSDTCKNWITSNTRVIEILLDSRIPFS